MPLREIARWATATAQRPVKKAAGCWGNITIARYGCRGRERSAWWGCRAALQPRPVARPAGGVGTARNLTLRRRSRTVQYAQCDIVQMWLRAPGVTDASAYWMGAGRERRGERLGGCGQRIVAVTAPVAPVSHRGGRAGEARCERAGAANANGTLPRAALIQLAPLRYHHGTFPRARRICSDQTVDPADSA